MTKELSRDLGATVLAKKYGTAKTTISSFKIKPLKKAEQPRVEKFRCNWFFTQVSKNEPSKGEKLKEKI